MDTQRPSAIATGLYNYHRTSDISQGIWKHTGPNAIATGTYNYHWTLNDSHSIWTLTRLQRPAALRVLL